MRRWCREILIALGALTLAGCAWNLPAPSITPAQAVARLETGAPLLNCREACLPAWRQAAPQAKALDAAARWVDLATLIERVDYQDDLSLYYLGRAAEGLGFPGAAASYYRQSTYLSPTTIGCRVLSRNCEGIALPWVALQRLAAIERELSVPRLPHPRTRSLQPVAPPHPVEAPPVSPPPVAPPPLPVMPAPAAETTAPVPQPPAPPPAPSPELPPPAPIAAPPPPNLPPAAVPSSDYIEPPPAIR